MKTIILSTLTAAALALTAGSALASDKSRDNGFAVYLQTQEQPASRSFLSGSDYEGYDHDIGNNAKDSRELRKMQQRDQVFGTQRTFLFGSDYDGGDHDISDNAKDSREFRKVQEQGRF